MNLNPGISRRVMDSARIACMSSEAKASFFWQGQCSAGREYP
jgi:hypothetical protein